MPVLILKKYFLYIRRVRTFSITTTPPHWGSRLASHGWVFESQLRQTLVVKTGNDCQTLGNRCKCHGSSEMTIINWCPVSQWYGTLKNCTIALNAEDRSKFVTLLRYVWKQWNYTVGCKHDICTIYGKVLYDYFEFQIQSNFNVISTLRSDIVQRWVNVEMNACWVIKLNEHQKQYFFIQPQLKSVSMENKQRVYIFFFCQHMTN